MLSCYWSDHKRCDAPHSRGHQTQLVNPRFWTHFGGNRAHVVGLVATTVYLLEISWAHPYLREETPIAGFRGFQTPVKGDTRAFPSKPLFRACRIRPKSDKSSV